MSFAAITTIHYFNITQPKGNFDALRSPVRGNIGIYTLKCTDNIKPIGASPMLVFLEAPCTYRAKLHADIRSF